MKPADAIIGEIAGVIFEAIGFLFSHGLPAVGKLLSVLFWGICGAIILPCVIISGVIYPMWEKWGEDLKS